jgi:AAA+ ATPase superfamily predicted ATPase
MEELRAPQRYMDILTAIAQGNTQLTEISNKTGINRENISTYLKTLETLDLTERITPVTDPNAKKGVYHIKDPFFQFWFRFIRPNKRQLELGLENNLWISIQTGFNQHLGHIFEEVCMEIIADYGVNNKLPIRLDGVGRWWKKDTEIDILAYERRGKTLLIEVKWSELSYLDCKRLLNELTVKASKIPKLETLLLGVMAKKIKEKERLREEGFWIQDLDDL